MPSSELEKRRRRIYKGLPNLTVEDRESGAVAAMNSAYYWWFEYLKLSKNYWWLCKERHVLYAKSPKLIKVGEDFGGVFELDFNDWWIKVGSEIFVEQLDLPAVKQLDSSFSNRSVIQSDKVIVEIPLNMTEQTIKKQVLEIVRNQAQREIRRTTSARRKLAKLKRIRLDVLEKARDIWCLNQIATLSAAGAKGFESVNSAKLSFYEIGKRVNLVESCMPKATDSIEVARKKRNGMKVAVKRMLLRADALIANAEIGLFPNFKHPPSMQCWTEPQQQKLDNVVMNGEWQPDMIAKLLERLARD
jgi:hypothetical protein